MIEKQKWNNHEALLVAVGIVERLAPHAERIAVAGSLRRRKPAVGDIEILFVPKMVERMADLLSWKQVSVADEEILRMLADGTLGKRLSKSGGTAWGDKNKLAVHRSTGIPVDLFATTGDAWHNYMVCRTGPAESNMKIAMAARERGYKWNPYGCGFTNLETGQEVKVTSEQEVFAFVGMPYAEPWERF